MRYTITTGQAVALIPARGGSKGVPRKNIKLLGGYPLLAYSLAAAQLSREIDRAIVSTEDEEISFVARSFGGEAPFLRPAEFATDSSGDREVVLHALEWLQKHEGRVPEFVVHLRPTTPLRVPDLVDEAIRRFSEDEAYTSLRSAHPAPESPYKWFRLEKEGEFKSLIQGLTNDELNQDRRVFPEAFIPDGYVDVLRTRQVLETDSLHGDRIMAFISPVCTEVDTTAEFDLLEYELERKGSEVHDYLRSHYKNIGS